MIEMREVTLQHKTRAIVCFGPLTDTTGMRPGEFYQVVIDPAMASPGGEYIRFDARNGDEIHGWQRIDGFTVCETLETLDVSDESVTVRVKD